MAPSLPHELWVVIFYFATYNTIRDMNYLVTLPPLAILYEKEDDELNDAALKIKHSLSLVCSLVQISHAIHVRRYKDQTWR